MHILNFAYMFNESLLASYTHQTLFKPFEWVLQLGLHELVHSQCWIVSRASGVKTVVNGCADNSGAAEGGERVCFI